LDLEPFAPKLLTKMEKDKKLPAHFFIFNFIAVQPDWIWQVA
jgi:hypothetical protein